MELSGRSNKEDREEKNAARTSSDVELLPSLWWWWWWWLPLLKGCRHVIHLREMIMDPIIIIRILLLPFP